MKKINLFSRLWSSGGSSQSSDVGSRCRVVADLLPSFCRVNHVLTLLVVMLFTIGSGNVWGADYSKNESWDFSTSGNANWTCTGGGSYCGGYGKKNASFSVSKYGISNFEGVNFSNHENVSLTIYVKAGTNSGTNEYTVKLLDGDGNVISGAAYTKTKSGGMGTGTNASSASESSLEFTPTVAFSGYKVEFLQKGFITRTRYELTYDDKAGGCANQVNITNSSTTSVTHGSFDVDKTGSQDACSALSVVVTPNPDDHYHVATVSATNPATTGTAGAAVDNRDGTYTITYSANAKGNSTISVTFAEDTKYTVTWMKNGSQHTTTEVYSGEKPTFPSNPSSCDGTSTAFYGWATSTWSSTVDNLAGKTVYTSAGDMPDVTGPVTYHAVFAKETPGSSYELVTSLSGLGNRDAYLGSYISYSGTRYYAGTSASALQNASTSGTPPALSSTTGLQKVTFTSTGTANQYYIKNSSGNYLYSNSTGVNPSFSATTCAWTFSDVDGNGRFKMISSLGTDVHLRAYATSTSAATFKTYGTTTNNGICVFMQSVSYSKYLTTCCTELGSIDGLVNLTQTETTMTVKDWSSVSNASSYTVKLYKWNGSSWTIVSGSTSGGGSGTQGTRTGVSDSERTETGVTWSSIEYGATYKVTVTAIGNGSTYCDGPETAVTSVNSNALTDNKILWKYSIYMDDGTNSDSGWGHNWISSLTSNTGSVTINGLTASSTYKWKLTLGGVVWYSANATMTSADCTNWTLYSNVSQNCGMTTGLGGNYTFTVNTGSPQVSVTYPLPNQDAGNIVYWDASIHGGNWTKLIFRVGTSSNANAGSDCKVVGQLVPGTDQFYKVTTASFTGMDVWAIANNSGWTGSNTNGVYKTNTGDSYAITKSSAYQNYIVDATGVTLIPAAAGSTGEQSHDNNCTFYPVTKTDGMLTHTATISATSHGSINIAYTDVSGTAQDKTATTAGLAHRTILTVSSTPASGYSRSTLTVNGDAHTSGNTHILATDATIAATFSPNNYTITLNNHSATTAGTANIAVTFDATTNLTGTPAITVPTKTGYTFGGYYTGEDGAGSQIIAANGNVNASVASYTSSTKQWIYAGDITLHAKWTINSHTLTWNWGGGSCSGTAGTHYTAGGSLNYGTAIIYPDDSYMSKAGYTFTSWSSDATTMPDDDLTITAQWTPKTDTYMTAIHTDSTAWISYASGYTATTSGAGYTIPNPGSVKKGAGSTCEDLYYHFAGWVADDYKGSPSGHIIDASGTTDATGTTYWAVWEKEAAGGGTSSITITRSTTEITATGYESGVERTWTQSEIDFGGHYIMTNNKNTPSGASAQQYIVMQKSNGTLYNTEELPGAITEVEVIQYSELACNVYCGDERLMASDNVSTGQTPAGTLITKPDDATTMTWTISASNNYRFFALKAFTSSSSGTNYITSVKVTYSTVSYEDPKVVCEACAADPDMTDAASALKGDFSLSSVGVTATGWDPGTNCAWVEKGFVWGSSANPTVSNNKVTVNTGTSATWDGALVPSGSTDPTSLSVGTTYHFRAYGKNGKDAAAYVYSADQTFTPRSVSLGSVTGGTISANIAASVSGKTITLTATPDSHFSFGSWTVYKTGEESTTVSVSENSFTMPDYNVTITATFIEDAYKTVVFKNNGVEKQSGKVYVGERPSAPTLTDGSSNDACDATSDKHYGWTQTKWTNTIASKSTIDAKTGAETVYLKGSDLPVVAAGDAATITYHAVWAEATGTPSDEWQLVTSTASLDEGDRVVLGYNNTGTIWLLGYQYITPDVADAQRYYNRKYASNTETVSDSKITLTSSEIATTTGDTYKPYVLTVGKSGSYWTFYDAVYGGYLYAAGTTDALDVEFYNKNLLMYQAVLTDAGKWALSINNTTGAAAFTSQTTSGTDRNLLKSNGSTETGVFSSYKSNTDGAAEPYIFKNLSTTSYQTFLTSCCDELITLSDPSIDGSGCTITFDQSSPVATCDEDVEIEAIVTVTPGFRVTALSFSGGDVVIDPSISTPLTSSQTYTLSFAQHTTATLTTTATVEALRDEYYDYMHDNVKKYNKDGNYNTVPTLSSKPAADDSGCKDDHYKFKGWVVEDEINENGTLKDGYTLILGGTTGKYATGKKYYAVWAEEE